MIFLIFLKKISSAFFFICEKGWEKNVLSWLGLAARGWHAVLPRHPNRTWSIQVFIPVSFNFSVLSKCFVSISFGKKCILICAFVIWSVHPVSSLPYCARATQNRDDKARWLTDDIISSVKIGICSNLYQYENILWLVHSIHHIYIYVIYVFYILYPIDSDFTCLCYIFRLNLGQVRFRHHSHLVQGLGEKKS